jgi:hypothetical protein
MMASQTDRYLVATLDDLTEPYHDQRPRELKASIEFIKEKGLLPIHLSDTFLPYLNILGLYTYLSGHISLPEHGHAQSLVSGTNNSFPEAVPTLEEALDMSFTEIEGYFCYGTNGVSYTRLLSAIGFHTVKHPDRANRQMKSKIGSTIPPYLVTCIHDLPSMDQKNQNAARMLMRDFITIFVDTRGNAEWRTLNAHLISQPDEESLRREAQYIIDATAILYPEIKWEPCLSGVDERSLHHTGYLKVDIESIMRNRGRNLFPARATISLPPPMYSIEQHRFQDRHRRRLKP